MPGTQENKNVTKKKKKKRDQLRAVPFKSVGGRRDGRFFEGVEGPNSELIFPIRLHMISGRRGGGHNVACIFLNKLYFHHVHFWINCTTAMYYLEFGKKRSFSSLFLPNCD